MHARALAYSNLKGNYELIDIEESELEATLERLKSEGYAGFNVTIPYKERIVSKLDEIEPHARKVGAINTVKLDADGRAIGFNTDAPAFLRSLLHYAGTPRFRSAVILGRGGACRAACVVLESLIPGGTFYLLNRDDQKPSWARQSKQIDSIDLSSFLSQKTFDRTGPDLFINATPLGQSSKSTPEFNFFKQILSKFPDGTFVFDMVYSQNSKFSTPFVTAAKERGFNSCDGIHMLALQAAEAFSIWTGESVTPEVMLGRSI